MTNISFVPSICIHRSIILIFTNKKMFLHGKYIFPRFFDFHFRENPCFRNKFQALTNKSHETILCGLMVRHLPWEQETWGWYSRFQPSVTSNLKISSLGESKFDLLLLSQCGSTQYCADLALRCQDIKQPRNNLKEFLWGCVYTQKVQLTPFLLWENGYVWSHNVQLGMKCFWEVWKHLLTRKERKSLERYIADPKPYIRGNSSNTF